MTVARGRRLHAVDAAMVQLIRLVLADKWSATAAAHELGERVASDTVLRCVRSRVSTALADRASDLGQRALATVDLALSGDTIDCEWPCREPLTADVAPRD